MMLVLSLVNLALGGVATWLIVNRTVARHDPSMWLVAAVSLVVGIYGLAR